jgi:HAD superfamily hydrolase (TIGR01509 family)
LARIPCYVRGLMPPMIFWDNDGVLVDTEPLFFRATAEVLAKQGVVLGEWDFKELSLRQGRSAFELLGDRADAALRARLREERNERFAQYLAAGSHLVPGVAQLLNALAAEHRMAVVTSCRREHFDVVHADTNICHLFDFVLALEDYALTKPHPDPYLAALRRAGLDAGQAVVVEDSPRGVRSARAAGLHCIAIARGMTRDGDFAGASAVVGDVTQVPAALARLALLPGPRLLT